MGRNCHHIGRHYGSQLEVITFLHTGDSDELEEMDMDIIRSHHAARRFFTF